MTGDRREAPRAESRAAAQPSETPAKRHPSPTAWIVAAALAAALTACGLPTPHGSAASHPVAARAGSRAGHDSTAPSLRASPRLARTPAPPFPLPRPNPPTHRIWPAVAAYLASRSGQTSVAVYDATTRRIYAFGEAERFVCASIVKLQIMATLLHDSERGATLTSSDRNEIASMIEVSDNAAANSLWDRAGYAPGIGAFDRLASMTQTVPDPYGVWGDTETSAMDQLRLLASLVYPSRLLNASDRAFALDLMEHVDTAQDWGVSAGVPDGSMVALKNGWLPARIGGWIVNSIGAVSGKGRDYLIAVLSRRDPSFAYGVETIQDVSTIVWRSVHIDGGV